MWRAENRGTRFSCTPYYPNAPDPLSPVPPVPERPLPASLEPPELINRYSEVRALVALIAEQQAKTGVPIWKSIQYMDHEGMELLRYPTGEGAVEKWRRISREQR